jgi:hypothetical protein
VSETTPVTAPVTPAAHTPADRGEVRQSPDGTLVAIRRGENDWRVSNGGHYRDIHVADWTLMTARRNPPTPARAAAAVLSDAELSDALGLWYRLRDDDGTLVETVARALYAGVGYTRPWSELNVWRRQVWLDDAAVAIEAVRGEVR